MSETNEKRITITFTDVKYHEKLNEWAKAHKLTQGEVIEVFLDDCIDCDKMAEYMDKKREEKVAGRTSIRAMIQKTKGMTPEQRKQVLGKSK